MRRGFVGPGVVRTSQCRRAAAVFPQSRSELPGGDDRHRAADRRRRPGRTDACVACRQDHSHRSHASRVTLMFFDTEKWQELFKRLRQNKLRPSLTAFGEFWGIFMLTVLLGADRGLENGARESFPRISNTIFIWSQGPTQVPYQGMPVGRHITLEAGDVEAIAKNVGSVSMIKGQNSVGVWGGSPPYTVRGSRNGAFSVQGGFALIEDIAALRIMEGGS